MAKPWARIEQNFINHQKFLALSANAICLWLEGKNYCDMYQTDGLIPLTALKTFRFDAAKSRTLLQTSCGLKPNGTPYAPLWESVELGGVAYFRMHDYLDHNDCRDAVLSRIAMADTRKEADRVRKAEARAAKDAKQRPQDVREMSARTSGGIPSEIRSITETETETKEAKRREERVSLASGGPCTRSVHGPDRHRTGGAVHRTLRNPLHAPSGRGAVHRATPTGLRRGGDAVSDLARRCAVGPDCRGISHL
jgi:hypothetical protein